MARDLTLLGNKLQRYRDQFGLTIDDVCQRTGIPASSLSQYESGEKTPTGDEVLILASFYKCDYKFLLTNERLAPFEQTEVLFRRFGDEFSSQDRWAVQEFLFLCEANHHLRIALNRERSESFHFEKSGSYFKGHGASAATALRAHLNYASNEVPRNIYDDFRSIGINLFRRRLENSNISGLFVRHPVAGACVLVNYSEDVYRQRFTAAHESGHAILDADEDFVVSFTWDRSSLVEVRANTFASRYLLPPDVLLSLSSPEKWRAADVVRWAQELRVSTEALTFALQDASVLSPQQGEKLRRARVPTAEKIDPELPESLTENSRARKLQLLQLGLSDDYVSLCFDAYAASIISSAKLRELLLLEHDSELMELAVLYGRSLKYGD